jgi:hypothetical protein
MMMNKKEILNRISGIISELNEQFDYLSQNADHLTDLELELFAANADFLSDHISILLKLNIESSRNTTNLGDQINNDLDPLPQTTISIPEKNFFEEKEEVAVVPEWKFDLKNETNDSFDFEDKPAEELFDRPLTEEEMRVIDEKTKLKSMLDEDLTLEPAPIIDQEVVTIVEEREEITSIVEALNPKSEEAQKPTLNEILATQSSQKTVSAQFNPKEVKDLKSLISLNDKLQFVRDLFNGYSLAYGEAIEILNRFDSFDAADNFLKQNYAEKNSWSEKQQVVDKFYEILSRRFSN